MLRSTARICAALNPRVPVAYRQSTISQLTNPDRLEPADVQRPERNLAVLDETFPAGQTVLQAPPSTLEGLQSAYDIQQEELKLVKGGLESLGGRLDRLAAATLPISSAIALKAGITTLAIATAISQTSHDPANYTLCLNILEQLRFVQTDKRKLHGAFKGLTSYDALRTASLIIAKPQPQLQLPQNQLNLYTQLTQALVLAGADGQVVTDSLLLANHEERNTYAHQMDVQTFLANVKAYLDFANKNQVLPASWATLLSL
ncbi:hypothetical protein C8J57DRAFT_662104 [Mycena rebaudengoi]|nr:hypothetical protein C8J57DRAFT_662104 [Mycena rebaudengoi]